MAFIAQAILFFIYKPGEFDLNYAGAVIGGVLLTLVVGEVIVRRQHRVGRDAVLADTHA